MNQKKKVLFLLEAFDKGGIEKVTLDIVNHIDPERYDITVQTFWFGGHCQSLVNKNVKVIPFFFKRYVRGIIRLIEYLPPRLLYRLFVHGDYDVEIAASDGGAAKVIAGSTNTKAKKICWVHMDVVNCGSKLREFQNATTAKRIYERFNLIACVSPQSLEHFQQKFGTYPYMSVVPNPLSVDEIVQKAKDFTLPCHKGIKNLVAVGSLLPVKGYSRLVSACAQIVKDGYHNFRLRIVGNGPEAETLTTLIEQFNLQKIVSLEGFQPNPYPYIANADWFVCSSLSEAFPLVLGESIVLNTPILAAESVGVLAWLGASEYGIVVDNSEHGITAGLRRILSMSDTEYAFWKKKTAAKANQLIGTAQFENWVKGMGL